MEQKRLDIVQLLCTKQRRLGNTQVTEILLKTVQQVQALRELNRQNGEALVALGAGKCCDYEME